MLKKAVSLIAAFSLIVLCIAIPLTYSALATVSTDLRGRVIILDPGHGEDNTNIYKDYDEHVAMLALALKIKPLLESYGATVYMTRPTEEDVILPVRAAIINRYALQALRAEKAAERLQSEVYEIDRLLRIVQSVIDDPEENAPIYLNYPFDYSYEREIHPDWQRVFEHESDPLIRERFLVISLHSNATGKPIDETKNGVEIYHISNDLERNANYYTNYSYEELGSHFAGLFMDSVTALGLDKRFVKPYYFLMTREHNLPCVLVENGFHTNDRDRAMLSDDVFLDRLASVYAGAVLTYFNDLGRLLKLYFPEPLDDVFG